MDFLKINVKGNYSKFGKFTAQKFSYILDKSSHADKVLKDKPRKKLIEKSYLEKIDNDYLDKSEDKDFIDIFDTNYKNQYNELIEYQKNKYFDYTRSCAINKKYNLEENKNNPEYIKRYRYHLYHHNQLDNKKGSNDERLLFIDQLHNKDFIGPKIVYSQSFHKMIGRDDKEIIRNKIKKRLDQKMSDNNKIKSSLSYDGSQNRLKIGNKKNKNKKKKKKNLKKDIKGVEMEKQLQRGVLPEHHDVRIRTAKGLDLIMNINDKKLFSSISNTLFLNKNNILNKLNDNNKKKILRLFSSIIPNSKNNLLIKDNINDKKSNEEKNDTPEKRIFSGFTSMKNINIKSHPQSSVNNKNLLIKSGKKDTQFNSDISNNNKTSSSFAFNKIKRNIYSDKNSSYSYIKDKSNINNKYIKQRLFSTPVNNKAVSFKKMLSRQYVNRVKVNNKIGAGLPLTPKYNIIYPKVVMKVMYKKKCNSSKKKEFKGLVGEYLHEVNKKNILSKYNTLRHISNFSKMFGRGTKISSKFPIFMNNINSRNAFDFCTEKSLKMNHFSNGKLNNPFSSFNLRKSFNNILSGKNRSKSIDNGDGRNHKESRLEYYNNNIDNIFKKVIYDDIVDNNIDSNNTNEKKSNDNEELLDLKKNPQLARTINLSYKNLISDYYRLNLDYLNKDIVQDKIDGITFEIIKSKNKEKND